MKRLILVLGVAFFATGMNAFTWVQVATKTASAYGGTATMNIEIDLENTYAPDDYVTFRYTWSASGAVTYTLKPDGWPGGGGVGVSTDFDGPPPIGTVGINNQPPYTGAGSWDIVKIGHVITLHGTFTPNYGAPGYQDLGTTTWTASRIPSGIDPNHLDKDRKGDPVQLATGVESRHRTLFSFKGARNWDFTLSYNSLDALSPTGLLGSGNRLQMGRGWSHNFQSTFGQGSPTELAWFFYPNNFRYTIFFPSAADSSVLKSSFDGAQFDTATQQPGGNWLVTHPDQSTQLFNAGSQLIEDTDPHGHKLIFTYSGGGVLDKLSNITDPVSGTSLSFTYNTNGQLTTLTDGTGATVQLDYSASGDFSNILTQITDQNGKHTTFTYDSNGQILTLSDDFGQVLLTNTVNPAALVSVATQADGVTGHSPTSFNLVGLNPGVQTTYTDHNGKSSVYTFDRNYNKLSEKDALNQTTSYTYDIFNQVTSITDPLNRTRSLTYDLNGNVLTTTDAAGKVTTYAYDARNNLLTTTLPPAVTGAPASVITRTYDSNNNLLTLTDALGRTTTWTYDGNSLPLTMTLPRAGVYQYAYTAGRLTQATDPNGVVTKFGYDGDGRLSYREDALGKRVTYTYDSLGNVLTVTNALNQTTTYVYDYRSRITSMTDPAGAVTTYTYDNNSNVLTSTDALGKVTTNTYDGEDRLKTVTDPLNRTSTYGYDDLGRLTTLTDPAGNIATYEYDAASQLTAAVDPLGKRTTSGYDLRGLVTGVTDPLNRTATFTYDDLGRRITAKDPLNRQTGFGYDALNRLQQVTDPGSLVAAQGFDNDGNRTSLTNPANAATAFVYDNGGRLVSETTPSGHATTMTYDGRGLPASVTQPSAQVTTMLYDDAGRPSSVTDNVGTISFTRDAVGRVLTVTEGAKTLTRVYEARGRLTSYTDGDGNGIGYGYDDLGRLTTLTYPGSKQVTYSYDPAGRLSTVTDWASRVTTYSYDAAGRVTQTLRPNGTKQTRTYDDAGQLTQLTEFGSDGVMVIYSGAHGYDAAGQLIGETIVPGVSSVPANVTQTFDTDNRLLTHNGSATTFDADGNLLSIASGVAPASYTYDARNRLTSAGGLSYTYNAENRRVALTDGTGTIRFAINPNAALDQVLVRTAADGTKTYYVYGLGLLHEETGSTVRFYHHDRRGDTIALSDGTGAVTDRASYGVYGELLSRTGTTNTPFLFNGKWGVQTDTSGIYYHRARYYHPLLRRFLNQDSLLGSLAPMASLNRFAYANGNPVTSIDPFGLSVPGGWNAPFTPRIAPAQPAPFFLDGPRGNGLFSMTIGAGATIGGVIALSPPAEALSLGASTAGVVGITTGIPTFLAGLTELISGKEVPTSPGDVIVAGGASEQAGKMVDLSLLLLDPESLATKPKSIIDLLAQVDAAKTGLDAAQLALAKEKESKSGTDCSKK